VSELKRLRVRCRGAVQGVGFRPAVYRLATSLGLAGTVANDPDGVIIEIEGPAAAVGAFTDRLPAELPPLAVLQGLETEAQPPTGATGFNVVASTPGPRAGALVPPDVRLCDDCRREMEDPRDRRHRYAFTTCTNCGPRFSLVHDLPYDRARTAMACFELCDQCRAEYEDPTDRRFHAEPVCCPSCGPCLRLVDADASEIARGDEAVELARRMIMDGAVVAVKGLGGFQLACRADSTEAVETLRARKRRRTKPFAVMARNLSAARRLVRLTPEDENLMTSPRSPVVLAPARTPSPVVQGVAPGLEDLGVLLPTTPLHVELLRPEEMPPLVMTSANLSDEPICRANREALKRLGSIADAFLLHDRDVVRRVDDSVVRSTPAGPLIVRRARGWVPEPVSLPVAAPAPILAVGGHLQVTACLAVGDLAFPSQHIGDLDGEPARAFLREVVEGLQSFLEAAPEFWVSDCHPDYPSSWLARELAGDSADKLLRVQHHLAHAAAVLGEHGLFPEEDGTALAISFDGTGWGPDATAWGGEWLEIGGDLRWRRLAHLEPLPLVGGPAAVRQPWRVAAAALALAGETDLLPTLPLARGLEANELLQIAGLATHQGWPMASGAGRLFEAAGAIVAGAVVNEWEGEAAVRLESLASAAADRPVWSDVRLKSGGRPLLPSAELLAGAARRVSSGDDPRSVAAGFHATFCRLAAEVTSRVTSPGPIALGGGCMVNRLLIEGLTTELTRLGFEPLLPRSLPPGDGGLSFGQTVLAAVALERGVPPHRLEEPEMPG